jgi:16S rRNA C967 or C1407 C5-methylase (RsmB/RsmF family)
MIPPLCLDLDADQTILDMTTQIASILGGKCQIVALEKFGVRYDKLVHTIGLQGAENHITCLKIDAAVLPAELPAPLQ